MNRKKLEIARMEADRSKQDMAKVIKKSLQSYSKKERGEIAFSDDEKIAVVNELKLDFKQFNAIFFDGKLPKWQE